MCRPRSTPFSRAWRATARRRYRTASEFLTDLRAVVSGEFVAPLPETLAVVDFENLSKSPDDAWIGSGIAETLAADLARLPGLAVVRREKVLAQRGRLGEIEPGGELLALGRLLPCRWVLAGGYQHVGRGSA